MNQVAKKQIVCFLTLEIFNNRHNSANCNPRDPKTQKIFIQTSSCHWWPCPMIQLALQRLLRSSRTMTDPIMIKGWTPLACKYIVHVQEFMFIVSSLRPSVDPRSNVAILPFSSGTTGPPKGVMITHYNLTAMMVGNRNFEMTFRSLRTLNLYLLLQSFLNSQVQYSDMPTGCALERLQPGQEQKTGISIIPMFEPFYLYLSYLIIDNR